MKDAYYFSHDSNAFNDPKIVKMVMELELEAYAIYWIIIEKLRNERGYKLHRDDISTIAYQCRCDQAKVEQILTKYKLFESDDNGHFYSSSLLKRMSIMDELKSKRQEAGRKGGIASSKAKAIVKHTSSMKGKERKGKERKEIKQFITPSLKEIVDYCVERKNHVDAAKWLNFYESKGWMVGKNKMKDWKASVRTWENRDNESSSNILKKEWL